MPPLRSGLFGSEAAHLLPILPIASGSGPRWRMPRQISVRRRPPSLLWRWLLDQGSLTAKLMALSSGHFRVEVVRQILGYPSLSEQACLGLRHRQLALVREVILYGSDTPWVFARSVLPLTSLTGGLRHLRKQGTRPLGAFLFSQPRLHRGPITVARIDRRHGYLPPALAASAHWGRRSVFRLRSKPLLVSEVFLTDLEQRLEASRYGSTMLSVDATTPNQSRNHD